MAYLGFLFDLDRQYRAVFGLTFTLDIVSEILVPIAFGFPVIAGQ